MLRIKAVLILKRNATRDYLDFAALFDQIGSEDAVSALRSFDDAVSANQTANRPCNNYRFNLQALCLTISTK